MKNAPMLQGGGGNTILPQPKKTEYCAINWTFTIWNIKENELPEQFLERCEKIKIFKMLYFSVEKGEKSSELHYQGFFQLIKKNRMTWLKKHFSNTAHFEKMRGEYEDNINYCSKSETHIAGPFFFGEFTEKGERTDLEQTQDAIKNNNGIINIEIMEMAAYARYANYFKEYASNVRKEILLQQSKKLLENNSLDTHQRIWRNILVAQDKRKILWVYDSGGNSGKTYFAQYMSAMDGALVITNGKSINVMEAYNEEPYVIINYAREQEEYTNYTVIENLKDGIIFKQKYNSKCYVMPVPPKIMVVANFAPELNKLSKDRWELIEINENNEMRPIKIALTHKEKERRKIIIDPFFDKYNE